MKVFVPNVNLILNKTQTYDTAPNACVGGNDISSGLHHYFPSPQSVTCPRSCFLQGALPLRCSQPGGDDPAHFLYLRG